MSVRYTGQCFLCMRDTTLVGVPRKNSVKLVFVCPHCGAENSASRVLARKDCEGRVCEGYGPVQEAV